jgi:hypothetical protein
MMSVEDDDNFKDPNNPYVQIEEWTRWLVEHGLVSDEVIKIEINGTSAMYPGGIHMIVTKPLRDTQGLLIMKEGGREPETEEEWVGVKRLPGNDETIS